LAIEKKDNLSSKCEENPTEEDEDLDEICELPTRITEILERSETGLVLLMLNYLFILG